MSILAIECTHQFASVAVRHGQGIVERSGAGWQKSAEALVPLVDGAMADAGLVPAELDCVAVSAGPGSFTALRIGMSVAKGIAYGAGCPLVPVSTLLAMASAAACTDASCIVPLIPSRPGEYFYACCRCNPDSGVLEEFGNGRCMAPELEAVLARCGAGTVVTVRDVVALRSCAPGLSVPLLEASYFSASSLLRVVAAGMETRTSASLSDTSPDYRQIFVPLRKKA
jgi:tRNA threonylcarbamoyladenosine biosynthesis protein TsaB